MIQDIYPHILNNQFKPGQVPKADDLLFVFSGDKVLLRFEEDFPVFPRVSDCSEPESLTYLFDLDGKNIFLGFADKVKVSGGFTFVPTRVLRKDDEELKPFSFAAVTAGHLADWYLACRYSGCCGKMTVPSKTERAMVCPSCGRIFYPRINPAVIVAVKDGDNLLLTKYAGRTMSHYALIAGYNEIGEPLEDTVRREVMEEVGLKVTNLRYYKSQPWGYTGTLLSGYYCDVEGSPEIRLDTGELKEAVWVPRKEITGQSNNYSLTNEMMLAFKNGLA